MSNIHIIPYVMTWDGIVTKLHKRYAQNIGIYESVEAYIQAIVLRKALESISYESRRGHEHAVDDTQQHSVRLSTELERTATAGVAATQIS